eukprot:2926997-Amphidinium_carterae.1
MMSPCVLRNHQARTRVRLRSSPKELEASNHQYCFTSQQIMLSLLANMHSRVEVAMPSSHRLCLTNLGSLVHTRCK